MCVSSYSKSRELLIIGIKKLDEDSGDRNLAKSTLNFVRMERKACYFHPVIMTDKQSMICEIQIIHAVEETD